MTVSQQDNKKTQTHKSGLNVAGHIVPWWVVFIVVLILLYIAYDNKMFDDMNVSGVNNSSSSFQQGTVLPSILPPTQFVDDVKLPQSLKNLFSI